MRIPLGKSCRNLCFPCFSQGPPGGCSAAAFGLIDEAELRDPKLRKAHAKEHKPKRGFLFGLLDWVDALAWAAILGLDTVQSTPALSLQGMFPSSLAVMVSVLTLGWGPEGPFGEFARYAAVATMALSLFRLNYAIRDAAEAREQRRRAFTDQLTGLPNRFALQALVEMSGKEFVSPTGWSLLVLDIDRIKDVNNTLGHEGGDSLIAMVAERLNGCLRPGDVLARLDGDQFAMLARLADPPQPFAGAERLTTVLEKPFELNGVAVALTACVGVSGTIDPVPAIGILLKEADLAMHHAKSEGPGLIHAFTGLESVSSLQRLRMRAALRADLASGGAGFELHYQPIVRIDHTSVFALEALVRLRHGYCRCTSAWRSAGGSTRKN